VLVLKLGTDTILFTLSYLAAFFVRVGLHDPEHSRAMLVAVTPVVLLKLSTFSMFGCYRSLWRYSSLRDLENLVKASLFSAVGVIVLGFILFESASIPRSVPFIDLCFTVLLAGGTRSIVRVLMESPELSIGAVILQTILPGKVRRKTDQAALIVGAGDAGEMILREIMRSRSMNYVPVGFIDDDSSKRGQSIHNIPVLGGHERIPELVDRFNVVEIIIAIPSATSETVRRILRICRNTSANLKILPDMGRFMSGEPTLSDLRQVEIEDLLGREQADLDLPLISSYLRGKRVLVTGAGGSIGAEICRQILRFAPSEIVLVGRGENSIFEVHQELARYAGVTDLYQVIGDVINKKKVAGIFRTYRPEIVFHAGADKHVPLMESNPDEAVFNNIIGTRNVLELSNEHGVERLVCISTDKAVNPTSVMGCCKRVAELLVRSGKFRNTVPIAVRFGNVLGSRGSVIPFFQKQIENGGPVTVTDRNITRYFMTIPEAASLVIQAGAMGKGGEVFVLDMGEPVKIWDLAENMIRLAGLEPQADIEIHEVGLRPGEKMDEELVLAGEERFQTDHPKIFCVREDRVEYRRLNGQIERLKDFALKMDDAGIRSTLKEIVPEYTGADPVAGRNKAIPFRIP